jgi:putative membrane protein
MPSYIQFAPTLDALLNGTAAVLLVTARYLIGRERVQAHKWVMIGAVGTSSIFLVNYLTYHALIHGAKHFMGQGWVRPVYFSILTSHTILAATIVPLVLITLSRGLKRSDFRHRAIARWTFPLWLYVSVTGVVIYLMLYHLA